MAGCIPTAKALVFPFFFISLFHEHSDRVPARKGDGSTGVNVKME